MTNFNDSPVKVRKMDGKSADKNKGEKREKNRKRNKLKNMNEMLISKGLNDCGQQQVLKPEYL